MQPETLNGFKDDDGCPDPGPEWVRLAEGKIEVDEKLGFISHGGKATLRDSSAKVVNDVALVMKGHPDIPKLRIEVYAPGVPKAETQKRADALRDFLVGKGVDAGRIEAVGMGAGATRIDFNITIGEPAKPGAAAPAAPSAPARRRLPRRRDASAKPTPATPPPAARRSGTRADAARGRPEAGAGGPRRQADRSPRSRRRRRPRRPPRPERWCPASPDADRRLGRLGRGPQARPQRGQFSLQQRPAPLRGRRRHGRAPRRRARQPHGGRHPRARD